VADGAVRMRETIRMKMRLLDSCAKDEKDSAQDGEHESFACPVAAHSSHDYRILYAADLRFLVMALLAKDEPGTKMTNRIARVLSGALLLRMKHGYEVGACGG
jgi:hypothetical protein